MRFATSCWLLSALTATTAPAQTHPTQKPSHKPVVARKPAPVARQVREEDGCSLPFEGPRDSTVALAPNEAYVYVEHMPELPGASGLAGIVLFGLIAVEAVLIWLQSRKALTS